MSESVYVVYIKRIFMNNKENILFDKNILTDVPQQIYEYRRISGIYFAITLKDDEIRFDNNEYPSVIKIGMSNSIIYEQDRESIFEQLDKRGRQSSTGTGFYRNGGYLFIPGKISEHIDDIVRKNIIPIISRHIDSLYNGQFTIDESSKGGPKEISYHVNKTQLFILFHLIYNKLYGVPFYKKFKDAYIDIIEDATIQNYISEIQKCSETALKKENTGKDFNTMTWKDTGFKDTSYYRKAFYMDSNQNERIAIVASNEKDIKWIKALYPNKNITIFATIPLLTSINQDAIEINENILRKYNGMFDIVLSNIPINGTHPLRIIPDVILHLVNKKTGRIAIIADDSLTSSSDIYVVTQDEYGLDIQRNYRIGEKNSTKVMREIAPILHGHITSISLENLNKEFDQNAARSFLNIRADFSKYIDYFEFSAYGWKRKEKYLQDCTIFGNTVLFKSIVRKILKVFPDTIKEHIKRYGMLPEENQEILIRFPAFKASPLKNKNRSAYIKELFGMKKYIMDALINTEYPTESKYAEDLHPSYMGESSKYITFNSKEEAQNYRANTRLTIMKYISAMTCQQTKPKATAIIPYIVDREYTDDEISTMIGFTREEISHMSLVISICCPKSALLNRMETGNKNIIPSVNDPSTDWSICQLY